MQYELSSKAISIEFKSRLQKNYIIKYLLK